MALTEYYSVFSDSIYEDIFRFLYEDILRFIYEDILTFLFYKRCLLNSLIDFYVDSHGRSLRSLCEAASRQGAAPAKMLVAVAAQSPDTA